MGFTIGIKIKFNQVIKTCETPRFIVDTGAASVNTRGLSVYTINGKIIAVVSTSRTTWRVSVLCSHRRYTIDNLTALISVLPCSYLSFLCVIPLP